MGHRQDLLAGFGISAPIIADLIGFHCPADILCPRMCAYGQIGCGGRLNTAGAGQELQLHPLLIRIIRDCLIGPLQIIGKSLIHKIVDKCAGLRSRLPLQPVQHSLIIVVGDADGHPAYGQCQQHEYRQRRVQNPPLAETAYPHGFSFLIPFRHEAPPFIRDRNFPYAPHLYP